MEYTTDEDESIVHLFGRDKENKRWHVRVYDFFPYFYVDSHEPVPKNDRIIKVIKSEKKNIKGGDVKKIICKLPVDVGGNRKDKEGLRNFFTTTYEDDIYFTTRSAIDLGIKSGFEIKEENVSYGKDYFKPVDFKANLRRLHLDIEVSTLETGGRIPNHNKPINMIYSIACYDTYLDKFVTFIWHYDEKNNHKRKEKFINPIAIDNKFEKEYDSIIFTFNNEKDMLEKFFKFVQDTDPDIITGWNSKKFDIPYILKRCWKLELDVKCLSPIRSVWVNRGVGIIKGRIVFDTWEGYKKTVISELESYKLDFVAKTLFKIGKVNHQGIDDMWINNRKKLLKYNIQDVFLEYAISEVNNVFGFFYDVKCFAGCSFEDVLSNSKIVDAYMLFKSKDAGIVLPSKRGRTKEGFPGAYVFQSKRKGIQKWVGVIDLKSLYPMILLTLNMGEDTIVYKKDNNTGLMVKGSKKETGFFNESNLIKSPIKNVYFRKDKVSFLNSILSELLNIRDMYRNTSYEYKEKGDLINFDIYNRLQTVVKFITNSIYGVLGWVGFRLYNKSIAAGITATGRKVIQFTVKVMEKLGYENYYGDTDSVFPVLKSTNKEDAYKEIYKLSDIVNKQYNNLAKAFNLDKHYFLMKPEKIYQNIVMMKKKDSDKTAKKVYFGKKVWEEGAWNEETQMYGKFVDKIDSKGLKKSDKSQVAMKMINTLTELITNEHSNKEITDYVKDMLNKIRNKEFTLEEIAFSKGISKSLDLYGNQDWIRAARWTNQHSGLWNKQTNYGGGSKPKFIYVNPDLLPQGYQKIEIVALDDDFDLPDIIKNEHQEKYGNLFTGENIQIKTVPSAIDYETVIEKTIGKKIENILDALDIRWKDVSSKFKTKSLREL